MHKKLTKRLLDSISNDTSKDLFIRDSNHQGFGIKVTPKNRIIFIAEGRIKRGKTKRITLGRYPDIDLGEANNRAKRALSLLGDGIDPHELAREEREKQLARTAKDEALSITLRELMEDFFESRQLKSEADYRKVIKVCMGDWLDTPVREITRQMVEQRYKKIAFKEGHKPQGAKATRYLGSIMNYGKAEIIRGEPLIINNPVDVLKEKRVDRSVKPKERYIQKKDLFKVIRAMMTECHKDARDLLLLQLFSGLRDQEAKKLKWKDLDFDEKTITIPTNKSKRTHIIPMGRFMYTMLQVRSNNKINDEYVFPNRRNDGPIGIVRKQILKVTKKTGVEFSHHDLRRSYATYLEGDLKVSESIIGRLLNHSPSSVTGKHYIKTNATRYVSEANRLYELIAADHDWTSDKGQRTGEGDWYKLAENECEGDYEKGYGKSLIHVLYGEDLKEMGKEGVNVDWKYIDEDIDSANIIPWHFYEDHGKDAIGGR